MENASKALLIAGSVLIVILLIALGMRIFNAGSSATAEAGTTMKTTEVATFNNKFTPYIGNNKSVAQVKALANIIIANNATNSTTVSLNNKTQPAEITSLVADLSGKGNINISSTDGTDGLGRITAITISGYGGLQEQTS